NSTALSEGPVFEEEVQFPFPRLCRLDYLEGEVQFLDLHHLLIKFGSVDGGVSRSADHHASFFAVYNMEIDN
ncbi:unnamed protein product, partial [Dovyalis caffra]